MINPEDDPLLSVAEIADVLRVSRMTVYRLVNDGTIPALRVGRTFRVYESSVRKYLASIQVGS